MTIDELRDILDELPGDWTVHASGQGMVAEVDTDWEDSGSSIILKTSP